MPKITRMSVFRRSPFKILLLFTLSCCDSNGLKYLRMQQNMLPNPVVCADWQKVLYPDNTFHFHPGFFLTEEYIPRWDSGQMSGNTEMSGHAENIVYSGYGLTKKIWENMQHVQRDGVVIFISSKSNNSQETLLLRGQMFTESKRLIFYFYAHRLFDAVFTSQ